MTATDRAAALELAALVVQNAKYGMVNDERLVTVARALLAAEAERERLAALVTRWEALGERHDLALRERGCQCQYEIGDSPCPIVSHCSECTDGTNGIQKCEEHATTDTERHDG